MPLLDLHLACPVHASPRVRELSAMFDMAPAEKLTEHFSVEIPAHDEPWQIGVIVGPSGSGKTTIAREAFGPALHRPRRWPRNKAVIDCLGDLPVPQIAHTLTAVGLGSPPSWLKPYAVLSNGEKHRCDLARALLLNEEKTDCKLQSANCKMQTERESAPPTAPQFALCNLQFAFCNPTPGNLIVFDEFTSLVDRTVAKISSAAVSRAIRTGKIPRRFVAVTCHYDVVQWLEPDWVIDMASQTLARGRLRRPALRLDVRRCGREVWQIFRRHHYLSGNLHPSAQCFVAYVADRAAAFTAVLPFPHPVRPGYREHRTVCLPDFQGVGIGNSLSAFVASIFAATGKPYFSTTSHPAIIRHRAKSPLWRMLRAPGRVSRSGSSGAGKTGMSATLSRGRMTASFEYVGPPRIREATEFGIAVPPSARSGPLSPVLGGEG
ncbi:MAG: putative transporter [Phycisphaerales bacterium]|nr:putative transporter [Phycisphaerales bacterium]